MLSPEAEERFRTDPARAVEEEIKVFVRESPLNRMPSGRDLTIFDEPLVRFAAGDDPLYTRYKEIIGEEHLTPQEAVAQAGAEVPAKLSIISYVLPIMEATRLSNRREKEVPSRRWSHTRYYGELFNEALRQHVVDVLTEAGYLAVSPALQPYFRTLTSEETGIFSVWSERHTAFAAGHGTFGLSDGFITPRGIAHRCGSVITDLPLPVSPRVHDDPYGNCVYYADGTCKACAVRCPADAITADGHDKRQCLLRLRDIGYLPISAEYNDETSVYGCGLCQTKVPCEYRIPAKIEKRRGRGEN